MSIQPGNGYGFTSSGYGSSLNLTEPFKDIGIGTPPWDPRDVDGTKFTIYPSTLNGLIPTIGGQGLNKLLTNKPTPTLNYDFSGSGHCYIYLVAGPGGQASNRSWPEQDPANYNYPEIIASSNLQSSDDDFGYIMLAEVFRDPDSPETPKPIAFTKFIKNPLWSERHKYSQPNSCFYYYYTL